MPAFEFSYMYPETLKLVASLDRRRPAAQLPARLGPLFRRLGLADCNAGAIEQEIWVLWMHHPHHAAREALDLAARDIAGDRFDIAETRIDRLVRGCPAWAEAWHKRATLYYLLGRDEESTRDFHRTLELEPRHFGALGGLGEICVTCGDWDAALLVFEMALRVNPHLDDVRHTLDRLHGRGPFALH